MNRIVSTIATIVLLAVGSLVAATTNAEAHTHDTGKFVVYLAPLGDDANPGTKSAPVQSLERAEEIIKAAAPNGDVEVRIRPGTYEAGRTDWNTFIPGHSIAFIPENYNPGDTIDDIRSRPVFRGAAEENTSYWFIATQQSAATDPNTRLEFRYLQVENFLAGGISITGGIRLDREIQRLVPLTPGANSNVIEGMVFKQIGEKWVDSTTKHGYGALSLTNSSRNQVIDNEFIGIENGTDMVPFDIHAIYASHFSSHNQIARNKFMLTSGNPVNLRNESNYNNIANNVFIRTGTLGYYSEWFCDYGAACAAVGRYECASHSNLFAFNRVTRGYLGKAIPLAYLYGGSLTYGGKGPTCSNQGTPRVILNQNTGDYQR